MNKPHETAAVAEEANTASSAGLLLVIAVLAIVGLGLFFYRPGFLFTHRSLSQSHAPVTVKLPAAMH